MQELRAEIEVNARNFLQDMIRVAEATRGELRAHETFFLRAYELAASLQAWRVYVVEEQVTAEAAAFLREGQNDALLAITLAYEGLWRPSLQSLRSMLEGVSAVSFYQDHPVELLLWGEGKHRLEFSDYCKYFERHPRLATIPIAVRPVEELRREHAELSRAVHASAAPYRMTRERFPAVAVAEAIPLRLWFKRYLRSVRAANLLLIGLWRTYLQGAALRDLRKTVSLTLSTKSKGEIRKSLGIRLFD